MSDDRLQLFEAELRATGRNRVQCNKRAVTRSRDLHGLLRVAVFAPDDLELVKGGPAERRVYLDELLGMLAVRYEAARGDFERVLKQRNALLRSGVRDPSAVATLDVLDDQLVARGRRAGAGSVAARRPARPRGERGVRRARRRRPTRRRDLRSGVGAGATRDRRHRRRSTSLLRAALDARRRAEIDRGRDARRPAPRRLEADDRGARRAHPGVAGRAAEPRAGACGSRAGAWCTSSPARRRCCSSTTCSASSTPRRSSALVRNLPPGPDPADDRGHDPRRRASPIRCCGSAPGRVEPREPDDRRDEPVPLRDAVAAVGRELGMPAPDLVATLVARRGRRSSASGSPRTPRCARFATACARSRSTDRAGRPSCGTPSSSSSSGPNERCGPGVVTSIRTVVRGAASGPERLEGPGEAPGSGTLRRPNTPPLTRPFACRNGVFEHADNGLRPSRPKEWTRGVRGQGHLHSQGASTGP